MDLSVSAQLRALKDYAGSHGYSIARNFVADVEVVGDEATLTYTIPMPNDGVTRESTSVLDFVQSGVLLHDP